MEVTNMHLENQCESGKGCNFPRQKKQNTPLFFVNGWLSYCNKKPLHEVLCFLKRCNSNCKQMNMPGSFTSQPRSRKLKPLVSEFSKYVTLICNVTDTTSLADLLDTLPKGARICHRRVDQGLCWDVANFQIPICTLWY